MCSKKLNKPNILFPSRSVPELEASFPGFEGLCLAKAKVKKAKITKADFSPLMMTPQSRTGCNPLAALGLLKLLIWAKHLTFDAPFQTPPESATIPAAAPIFPIEPSARIDHVSLPHLKLLEKVGVRFIPYTAQVSHLARMLATRKLTVTFPPR